MRRSSTGAPSHRGRRSAIWPALTAVALLGVLGAGCGPSNVAVADLVTEHEAYDGEEIVLRGVVVDIDREDVRRHAVLQDQNANRVELAPFEEAQPHVGSIVEVTGKFEFDPERGRVMHIDSIEPIER